MPLFKRSYKIVFPDIGYEIQDSLKISFEIDKDLTHESNKSKLSIWNLSDDTRQKLEVADLNVEIYAGYEQNGGPVKLFVGSVIHAVTTDNGTDVQTELTLSDGQVALRDSVFSLSFAPGTSGKTITQSIASKMGIPILYGENVTFQNFPNGYSFVGHGGDALTEVCNGMGCDWSIQNGIIQTTLAGGINASRGLVFEPDSGLIGSPERIIRSEKHEAKETPKKKRRKKEKKEKPEKKAGWKIKTLLAPSLNCGDAIKVNSRYLKGWFKVESIRHAGDSYDGEWVSEIELIEGATT